MEKMVSLNKPDRIEKNTLILLFTQIVFNALVMIVTIAVARKLGVANLGLIEYASAFAGTCLIITNNGFNDITVRELAKKPKRASLIFVNMSALRTFFYIPAMLFCILFAAFSSKSLERVMFVFLVFLVTVTQLHIFYSCSFFRAIQKMEREAQVRLTLAVLLVITGLAVVFSGLGIFPLFISKLSVSLFSLGWTTYLIIKDFKIKFIEISWRYIKRLFAMSTTLVVFYLFVTIYLSINVLILNHMKGDIATGYYSAAFKIYSVFIMIAYSIGGASLPALSKRWGKSKILFKETFYKSGRYLLLFSIPIVVGGNLLAKEIIFLLYGKAYLLSVDVVRALFIGLPFGFMSNIFTVTLISMKKDKVVLAGSIVGALSSVLLGLIFINKLSSLGAALAQSSSLFIVFSFQFLFVLKECVTLKMLWTTMKSIMASFIMAIFIKQLLRFGSPIMLIVGIAIFIYALSLILLREINSDELKYVYSKLHLELFKS